MSSNAQFRTSITTRKHWLRDRLGTGLVWLGAILVLAVFCWIVFDLVLNGISQLSFSFLWELPRESGRAGGIRPVIVSTFLIVWVCMSSTIPAGMGTAIFLAEYSSNRSLLGRIVRRGLDALASVPSVVFGLFGNALFCVALGMGYSILSGGLTLTCMVLPLFIRTAEEGLRAVPDDYRKAAAALGMSKTTTMFKVLIPAAAPSLIVGFVLSVGRALAETAALIFTSGSSARMPDSLFDSGRSISVHIFELAFSVVGGSKNAYATAITLIITMLVINTCAAIISRRFLNRQEGQE